MRGRVKWFNAAKGFGFITPDAGGADAFVHESEVLHGGRQPLLDGEPVEFDTEAGQLGPMAVRVRRLTATDSSGSTAAPASPSMPPDATEELRKMLSQAEIVRLQFETLSPAQHEVLFEWGMRMLALGQHRVANIEAIKYDGRLIVLDDGSRWKVDTLDTDTADMWTEFERVAIIDNEMYRLDELEKVHVEEEFG